jgi:hypothetical protein
MSCPPCKLGIALTLLLLALEFAQRREQLPPQLGRVHDGVPQVLLRGFAAGGLELRRWTPRPSCWGSCFVGEAGRRKL